MNQTKELHELLVRVRHDAALALIRQNDHFRALGPRVTDFDRHASNEAAARYDQATRRLRAIS